MARKKGYSRKVRAVRTTARRIRRAGRAARKFYASRKARTLPRKKRYWISRKIRKLMREGKKQVQAIAIAFRMAGVARPRKRKGRR